MSGYILLLKKYIFNNLLNTDKIRNRPYSLNLIIPVLLALAATYIKIQLFADGGNMIPFLLYLAVILVSGCYGGSRSALISIIAIVFLSWVWFIRPASVHKFPGYTILELLAFVFEGLMIVGVFYIIERILMKLSNSEERFRRIIDRNAEGLLMCDNDGLITYNCASTTQMLGYPTHQLKNKRLQDFIHPDEEKNFNYRLMKLQLSGSGSMILQQRIRTSENKWIWIECCINNLLNDHLVKAMIVHFRNITTRIDQEHQQEDFIHMASHELKSPITAIKGFLQLLKKRLIKDNQPDYINLINRSDAQTEKLLTLIDDMLNITKIKAGEMQYHFEKMNINECLKEAVEASRASTTTHHIHLDELPAPVQVNGDKVRIGQVITNLINNAVKYSPEHDKVYVKAEQEPARVKITVTDHGIGIPKEKQQRIFDRFYRVDTLPKGKFQGLGLGLFIASEIINRHQGHMGVDSEDQKGSSFWFTLPFEQLNQQQYA